MCRIPFWGHYDLVDLDLWPSFKHNPVLSIYFTFFKVGIPFLVCRCIMGLGSVSFHFGINLTVASDLILNIFVCGAYLLHYLR